jgi:hypothetical protein
MPRSRESQVGVHCEDPFAMHCSIKCMCFAPAADKARDSAAKHTTKQGFQKGDSFYFVFWHCWMRIGVFQLQRKAFNPRKKVINNKLAVGFICNFLLLNTLALVNWEGFVVCWTSIINNGFNVQFVNASSQEMIVRHLHRANSVTSLPT